MQRKVYLGVGSNLGDREANLQQAQKLLNLTIERESSLYETEPVELFDQPWFLNAVWEIATDLSPHSLLDRCQAIEADLGRIRSVPKGPRSIDLDILFYGEFIISEPRLIVPHPSLHHRKFVLIPLNEVAPAFEHPVLRKTVGALLRDCNDPSVVSLFRLQEKNRP